MGLNPSHGAEALTDSVMSSRLLVDRQFIYVNVKKILNRIKTKNILGKNPSKLCFYLSRKLFIYHLGVEFSFKRAIFFYW